MDTSAKDEMIFSFAEWLRDQGKSANTIKTYTGVLSQFCDQTQKILMEIHSEDVQGYLDYLENCKKSPGTIEKHYIALNVFFKFLGKPQVMLSVERKVKEHKLEVPETLSLNEQQILLRDIEAEGNLRNIAIVYLLLHTGIRVSELCDLNGRDVIMETERNYILVRNAKGEIDRSVPLTISAIQHVQNYLFSLKEKADPLFISSYNQRITPRSVQYILKKYNVHPHKLRHTFCQRLVDNGIDIQTISKLAGHKDLNVTKRYLKEKSLDLANAIDQTFTKH
ncbi:tyrosine-type recombinase/integrase [Peribacillus frigoritolerans]|jgi:integrase/recombinase XerD|uniref:Tyrosine-type recombinase/integrase n=1 Tax=Peribacillus frigoritolerans TaxID=450367 RepID=A0AAJ1QJ32_9BACI|nr:tyrosine-type recombinase/integrase [Peribacillus frigoritolerans]MBL3646012.1 tyrosine-type recombinase/integrase [Bacillus sp. RHFB]MCD1163762.1 tyrosine-type recombinase/integrase [Peribacillus castrilensis]MDP9743384.1 integrase/recombinase XerD [Bacillus sp. B2I3]MCK2005951.1 tyrosine-type recombinase/integrase [Peribacillus frigoritolerans]MDF1998066.1 tyrosine-type recombinase/integrase [Peribacillus frigoritolerans]